MINLLFSLCCMLFFVNTQTMQEQIVGLFENKLRRNIEIHCNGNLYRKVPSNHEIALSTTDFKVIIPKQGCLTVKTEEMFYAYVYADKNNKNEPAIYVIEGLQYMHEGKPVLGNTEIEVDLDENIQKILYNKFALIKSYNDVK